MEAPKDYLSMHKNLHTLLYKFTAKPVCASVFRTPHDRLVSRKNVKKGNPLSAFVLFMVIGKIHVSNLRWVHRSHDVI